MTDAPAVPAPTELPRVLAATLLTQAAATWAMLAMAAVAPLAAQGLGVAAVMIGYQITLAYAAASATSFVAAGLTARWGPVRISQAALVSAAAGAGLAAVGALWGVAAAAVLRGVGYGLTNPAASQLLAARTDPARRSFVFSIKQTGVPLGAALAGLLTPPLASWLGWQAAVAAVAPAALALALALEPARKRWDTETGPAGDLMAAARAGARLVWRDPGLKRLALASVCFGMVQLSLMSFVVTYAVAELAFSAIAAGALLAAVQAAGASGRLGWGWIADRLGANAPVLGVIAGVSALATLAFGAMTAATPAWAITAAAMVFGVSAVGWNGVYMAEIARLAPPGRAGAATGFAAVLGFGGVVIGPAAFVQLHGALGGYGPAFLTLAVPAVIGGALALASGRAR